MLKLAHSERDAAQNGAERRNYRPGLDNQGIVTRAATSVTLTSLENTESRTL